MMIMMSGGQMWIRRIGGQMRRRGGQMRIRTGRKRMTTILRMALRSVRGRGMKHYGGGGEDGEANGEDEAG